MPKTAIVGDGQGGQVEIDLGLPPQVTVSERLGIVKKVCSPGVIRKPSKNSDVRSLESHNPDSPKASLGEIVRPTRFAENRLENRGDSRERIRVTKKEPADRWRFGFMRQSGRLLLVHPEVTTPGW